MYHHVTGNIWSGIIGGFFLQLSYLGTDQSQVGRYLTGKSTTESRLGLVMNSLVKIPMQFLILLIVVLVFVFYIYNTPPLFFNKTEVARIEESPYATEYKVLEEKHRTAHEKKQAHADDLLQAINRNETAAIDLAQYKLQQDEVFTKRL